MQAGLQTTGNLFRRLRKSLLMGLCLVIFAADLSGCMQAEPLDPNQDNTPQEEPQAKPDANGRVTLSSVPLQISEANDSSQPNAFYISTLATVNSVVKEYTFNLSYESYFLLNFDGVYGKSCSSTPQGEFYLINDRNDYMPLSKFTRFGLIPGKYRLQFRVNNLNCLGITVRFGLRRS